jgi:hypothetical protein
VSGAKEKNVWGILDRLWLWQRLGVLPELKEAIAKAREAILSHSGKIE